MNLLLFIPGLLILIVVAYDLLTTTFAPRGAGILTARVTTLIWSCFLSYRRLIGNPSNLAGAGVVIVFFTILNWVVLIWLACFLIFSSDPLAVVNSETDEIANINDRIYYSGYILSTMGNGDLKGGTQGWRVFSSICSFSGLMFITIAITYMVPVLSAVTERRSLSIQIASLGNSPQAILQNYWDGASLKSLDDGLKQVTADIIKQGQTHLAYPVLHYFHNADKITALLPNLVALDEALSIILLYIPKERQPSNDIVYRARRAITSFLSTIRSTFIDESNEEAPALEVDGLLRAGVPLLEPDEEKLNELQTRRRVLKAMVIHNGWSWNGITEPAFETDLDFNENLYK